MCAMSVLENPATENIDWTAPSCSNDRQTSINLYQTVGASLDGSDYLAVTGTFNNDEGSSFADDGFTKAIGFVAMVLASANVVGGWFVTDRMLEMFKRRPEERK